jgi:hypothetical protein
MQLFYKHLLNGDTKGEALRVAQCSLLQQKSSIYNHPYFWAAFRLVGEVGPLKNQRANLSSFAFEIDPQKKLSENVPHVRD